MDVIFNVNPIKQRIAYNKRVVFLKEQHGYESTTAAKTYYYGCLRGYIILFTSY